MRNYRQPKASSVAAVIKHNTTVVYIKIGQRQPRIYCFHEKFMEIVTGYSSKIGPKKDRASTSG